jgi:hypothetical protein
VNQRSNRLHVSAVTKRIHTHFHLMKKYSGLGPVTVNLKRRKEKARLMVQRASKI